MFQDWNSDLSFGFEVSTPNNALTISAVDCQRVRVKFSTTGALNVWPLVENLGFEDESFVIWCGFYVSKVLIIKEAEFFF